MPVPTPVPASPAQAPEPGPAANAPAQGSQAPQGDTQTTDWKAELDAMSTRFNGLMSTYQKERAQWTKAQADALAQQQRLEELTGTFESLRTEHGSLKDQFDQRATELEVVQQQAARMRYIAEKHPDLLSFELQGLLPDGAAGEELEALLGKFRGAIAGVVRNVGQGGAPPPPPAQPPKSSGDLMAMYQKLAAEGKVQEANQVLDQFFTGQR